ESEEVVEAERWPRSEGVGEGLQEREREWEDDEDRYGDAGNEERDDGGGDAEDEPPFARFQGGGHETPELVGRDRRDDHRREERRDLELGDHGLPWGQDRQ